MDKHPRSKTRDMEVPAASSITRGFMNNPAYPAGGSGQKSRGDTNILKFPSNPQPKTVGKLKTSIKP